DEQTKAFGNIFSMGLAILLAKAEDLPATLKSIPQQVEAPVPVLHRRIDGADVLFVPAASPHATQNTDTHSDGLSWLRANYKFDPARYQKPMKITVHGFKGTPQLWDAVSGERRRV